MFRFMFTTIVITLCSACSHSWDDCGDLYCLDVRPPQHADGVGAAQGLDVRDDGIWIIGDADTGVARAFAFNAGGDLEQTGSLVTLTENGTNLVPHPTGLTEQPGLPTFLGNTVGGRGEILLLDWSMAEANGTLDGAVLNVVPDGEAAEGSRPELVWVDNRWLVASADYGNASNEVRLYDPDLLESAANTTDAGVLVARYPSPPYVQSLHYWADEDVLILVRNQKSGDGWRLTFVDLPATWASGAMVVRDELEPGAPGELEGFSFVSGSQVLMVTSSGSNNAYPGTLTHRSDG